MTAAQVNTLVDAAVSAMDSADWSTAESKLMQAKARLIALPDSERGDTQLQWNRDAIDNLISQVRQKRATKQGTSSREFEYQQADDDD